MFLFKILTLREKIDRFEEGVKVAEEWINDPVRYAREYAKDIIIGYVSAYIFAVALILGFLALLGFTELLGGPHQPARVLLYALLIVAFIIGVILYAAWRKLRNLMHKLIERYKVERSEKVIYEEVSE